MKISIAMATYNGAKYLKAQLQSFIDQTRQPDELIITDDCSTDDTEIIVHEFAKVAPFTVEFYRNEKNLGYCGNFNAALTKTTGDLVFLSDQDDVWFAEKIEHIIGVGDRHPKCWILTNDAYLTDSELTEVGLTKLGQIRAAGMPIERYVMGCCCAVRRELLDLALPIPKTFDAHDAWLVWFADGLKRRYVDERVLQYYRRHENNESDFLANRLVRMTKFAFYKESLTKAFSKSAEELELAKIERLKIFRSGVQEAKQKGTPALLIQLNGLHESISMSIQSMEVRADIRKQPFFTRILSAIAYWLKGGYSSRHGFKGLMRDLIG